METRDLIRFVNERKLFLPRETVLLAVSGGIDSMVMTDLFLRAGFRFGIAHCNFGLRGAESDADEQFVRQTAYRLNVPFHTERFETEAEARRTGISIQMAARDLRYAWFEKIRQEHDYHCIATAHHLDDQAETFLINLARGTGIAGLHGIPVHAGHIIRPMMFAYRHEIQDYATRHRVDFRHDASNDEIKYIRNKIRHEIIPALKEINPDFIRGLTETIRKTGDFEQAGRQALDRWSAEALHRQGSDLVFDLAMLPPGLPPGPYLWQLMAPYGFNETQLENLTACLYGEGRKSFLSPTHRLDNERGMLRLSPRADKHPVKTYRIEAFDRSKAIRVPVSLRFRKIADSATYEIPATGMIASLDLEKIVFPLTLRRWCTGDSFHPLGMKKRKKLSDFFIDSKLSRKDRENIWLLCSGDQIAWILGYRIDHRFRVTAATRKILRIEYSEC